MGYNKPRPGVLLAVINEGNITADVTTISSSCYEWLHKTSCFLDMTNKT